MAAKAIAAVAQLCSTNNKVQNMQDIAVCARLAKAQGAAMLFLPECFGFLGSGAEETLSQAEDPRYLWEDEFADESSRRDANDKRLTALLKDTVAASVSSIETPPPNQAAASGGDMKVTSLMDALRTIAVESGLWISGGGLHVSVEDEAKVYNTHVIIDNEGKTRSAYRKIHLFDVSIPGKVELLESKTTKAGGELVSCQNTPLGSLGLTTCYDMRFPEQYIALRRSPHRAQIMLVPSAFTVPTGQAHWHTLLKARAIETQCYVIAAAQYGQHNDKRTSYGHSLIVDPWGKVIADAGGFPTMEELETQGGENNGRTVPPPPPSIITAEIDLEYLETIRQRMPIEMHRADAKF
jgi:predicted amidohydrolase